VASLLFRVETIFEKRERDRNSALLADRLHPGRAAVPTQYSMH
jgi:hypothetical protein